jgi:cystathionine beta-lyase
MHTVAMYAPSKTFNLAGLIGSYHIVYNKWINDRMAKESSLCHYNSMNVMSMHALIGGYSAEGRIWLDELREVLKDNVDFAYDHILKNYPGVTLAKPEGTYMLFLNCEQWCKEHNITIDELQKKGASVGVMWQDGRRFFEPYGIRMNLALPFSRVKEAFDRLDKYVFTD